MTLITIEVPDDVAARVNAAAAERGVAPEQVAGEAVAEKFAARRALGFIGIGSSREPERPATTEGGAVDHKQQRRAHFAAKTSSDV